MFFLVVSVTLYRIFLATVNIERVPFETGAQIMLACSCKVLFCSSWMVISHDILLKVLDNFLLMNP